MHARSVPYSAGQVVQTLASFRSIQSATHSETFPTMSYAPTSEVQPGVPVGAGPSSSALRSEEHTSELQSRFDLVCRLLLEKKKKTHASHLHHPPEPYHHQPVSHEHL